MHDRVTRSRSDRAAFRADPSSRACFHPANQFPRDRASSVPLGAIINDRLSISIFFTFPESIPDTDAQFSPPRW